MSRIVNIDKAVRIKGHLNDTAAHIPTEMHKKYKVSSKGDFTGFLNLTIDKAPTSPSDNARLFEITDVTHRVIKGNKNRESVCESVVTHF